MLLNWIDWLVIVRYLLIKRVIGVYYRRHASGNIGQSFVSRHDVSWWLARMSMVATTFVANIPQLVIGFVVIQGILSQVHFISNSVVFSKTSLMGATAGRFLATLLIRPESEKTLAAFYRRVHPAVDAWKRIAKKRLMGEDGTTSRDPERNWVMSMNEIQRYGINLYQQ